MRTAHPTPQLMYRDRQRMVSEKLSSIRRLLSIHARNAKADPQNWGYAGDLGYVLERLAELEEALL